MKRLKLKNGSLERLVQHGLHTKGLRFRRHVRNLPGRPDIVFPLERVAIFVDGDSWHGWRLPAWEHKLSKFWRDKLHANRTRDRRNFRLLRAAGWRVIRLWQHAVQVSEGRCVDRIESALKARSQANRRQAMRLL